MIDLNLVLDTDKRVEVGNFYVKQDNFDTGLSMFESALDADPKNLAALCNGAYILMRQKNLARAEHWVRQALGVSPEHAHALGTFAQIAQESSEYHAARVLFEHSLRNEPGNITTLLNYAYMLQLIGDYPEALQIYTQARDVNVMDASVRFQRAMCLLTIARTPEQWREAWGEYEIRHFIYGSGVIPGKILYTGEDVGFNGHLLMVAEQGIGDAVMAARYARHVKDNLGFEKVYMLCKEPWKGLMQRVEGIDGVYSELDAVPTYQHYIPMMSLMGILKWPEVRPSAAPYMRRAPRFASPLSHRPKQMQIGICWQGNPQHGNDRWRSIGVDRFCDALAGIEGAEFYSLHQPEVSRLRPDFVKDLNIDTLENLADAINSMDLVITVDTSHLHIAGAMGVPTYALIPSNPDFRWQSRGPITDLYPSVTLFRAKEPLQWKSVLERVREQVVQLIQERNANA